MIRWRAVICGFGLFAFQACGGGYSTPTAPSQPPPASSGGNSVTVGITQGADRRQGDAFGVNPLSVPVGSRVVWMNGDTVTHNAISDGGAFSVGSMAPGGQGSFTFSTAGTFPYHCGIHPNMTGTIVVQ